jgi:hypothetical protein
MEIINIENIYFQAELESLMSESSYEAYLKEQEDEGH